MLEKSISFSSMTKEDAHKLFKTNDLESLKGDDLIMNELADKIENLNNDTEFVYKLDARERAEREQNARMTAATEKGLKEGREKGSMEKAKEIAKKLKQMNMSSSQIEEATGLTKEEIESL